MIYEIDVTPADFRSLDGLAGIYACVCRHVLLMATLFSSIGLPGLNGICG